MEFLTGEKAQQLYGEINFEYPVHSNVAAGGVLQSFGEFKRDELEIEKLSELGPSAQMIIDRIGW
jgi:iron(III) transport system substrate-binding protein